MVAEYSNNHLEQVKGYEPQVGDRVRMHIEDDYYVYFDVHEVEPNFVNDGAGFGSAIQFTELIQKANGDKI